MEKTKPKKELMIKFTPRTKEEENHLSRLKWIIKMKRKGDWGIVGDMVGLSWPNTQRAFQRVYSKHHLKVVETMEQVINKRLKELAQEVNETGN